MHKCSLVVLENAVRIHDEMQVVYKEMTRDACNEHLPNEWIKDVVTQASIEPL